MKITALLVSLCLSLPSFAAMTINSAPSKLEASKSITYTFELADSDTNKNMTDKDLVKTHTKILHLIIFDESLNEFNHVHPEFNGSNWSVDLNLATNGKYTVWAQGKTSSGNEFSVSTDLTIENGKEAIAVTPLGDVRAGTDGTTQVSLASTKIKAGKMVMLDFKINRTDGTNPSLSPYLGAFAHVIATQLHGGELIHVHPMEGNKINTGMLHATFPISGEYRIWIQFNDNNQLKTIPLSVVVK